MPEQTEEIFLSWDELSSGNRKKVNRVKIGQCREKSGQNQVRREHSVANNSEFPGIICKFTRTLKIYVFRSTWQSGGDGAKET